jgi:hypothetical protein
LPCPHSLLYIYSSIEIFSRLDAEAEGKRAVEPPRSSRLTYLSLIYTSITTDDLRFILGHVDSSLRSLIVEDPKEGPESLGYEHER